MALNPVDRALLELLLQRGHTYADIAELQGIAAEDARARAHRVLGGIAGADVDEQLSDYLLGQLRPSERVDFERVLLRDAGTLDLGHEMSAKLRLLVPRATLPDLPEPGDTSPPVTPEPAPPVAKAPKPAERAPEPAPAVEAPRRARPAPRAARPPARRLADWGTPVQRRIAAAAGLGAVLVAAVVLALTTGDDGNGNNSAGEQVAATPTPPLLPVIELAPSAAAPEGATGQAALGPAGEGAALEYSVTGLKPTRGDQRYVVWLYNNREAAVPVTEGRKVGSDGNLRGVAAIPKEVVSVLPQTRFVDISLEPSRKKSGTTAYKGESIVRGHLGVAVNGDADG